MTASTWALESELDSVSRMARSWAQTKDSAKELLMASPMGIHSESLSETETGLSSE